MNRMQPIRVWLPLLALSLPLVVGCGRGGPREAGAEGPTATPVLVQVAARGSLEDTVVFTGTAQAAHDTMVMPEMGGKVDAVYVRPGDRVRRGQALVRLDSDLAAAQAAQAGAMVRSSEARREQAQQMVKLTDEQTRIAIRSAESGVEAARQHLQRARAAADLTRQQVENGIARAQTGLESAESTLRDVQAGARRQEISQAQARVASAESGLRLAESDYQRVKRLFDQGAVAAQQLDSARTQYELAQANVAQAREALSLAQEGARTEQVRLAELGVQQARQQIQLAEAQREQIRIAERDVAAAEAAFRQAQEGLVLAQEQRRQLQIQEQEARAAAAGVAQAQAGASHSRITVAKHTIYAPFAGVIAERLVEPGTGVGTSTPLVRLVDLQPMKIETQVSELQVDRLRVGMNAQVSVDGLPQRAFSGRLARIRPAADPGQRTYTVEVEVANPQDLIRPGMFCRVTVLLDTVHDTIVVPRDVLVESGEQRLVYVVEDGKVAIREVKLGARNSNLVEIVEGLQPGDLLITSGQSLLARGQAVQPQEMADGAAGRPQDAVTPEPPGISPRN